MKISISIRVSLWKTYRLMDAMFFSILMAGSSYAGIVAVTRVQRIRRSPRQFATLLADGRKAGF